MLAGNKSMMQMGTPTAAENTIKTRFGAFFHDASFLKGAEATPEVYSLACGEELTHVFIGLSIMDTGSDAGTL